ncbi:MAG: ABC transporter permease [Lachnospiraceae bacterium]|nr:ABC transporter permease [Lachnospiraceae bacterium]
MKTWNALMKKEWIEQVRTGKLMILSAIFVLFGIMNPAIAKLTPWLLKMMADSLAESGMIITDISVSALDSWVQFFKNMPIALIVFVLVEGGIFTREYQSGTLVLTLTKGLDRKMVVLTKAAILFLLWSAGYWLCFGITYGYNMYFWDNAAASHLLFSVIGWWLFGVWVIALMVLFSSVATANTGVFLGAGGSALAAYLMTIFPKLKTYSPAMLTEANALIYGKEKPTEYMTAIAVAAVTGILCLAGSLILIKKKKL